MMAAVLSWTVEYQVYLTSKEAVLLIARSFFSLLVFGWTMSQLV